VGVISCYVLKAKPVWIFSEDFRRFFFLSWWFNKVEPTVLGNTKKLNRSI
jgi:hypothetical protein